MRRAAVAALAGVLALSACSSEKDAVASGTEFVFVAPGGQTDISYDVAERKSLGELQGPSLADEAKRIKLSDYRGKVIVLNVWGSWCGPCRIEAPELQKFQDANADKAQVLGLDVRETAISGPRDFVKDRNLTYPSIYDPAARTLLALRGYPRAVVPATFVIDKQGRVAAAFMRDLLATDIQPVVDRVAAE